MDFRLTEAQQQLAGVARELLRKRCTPKLVQELALGVRGFPDDLWREMSGLGWPGLLVPADFGGSEGGLLDVVLLVEEMGRVCLPGPYVQSAVVATLLLAAAGSSAQREHHLPAMALGQRLATLALTEESATFTPDGVATRGEAPGVLRGRKLFVKDAHVADHLVVVARGGGGINLLLVERGRPGVTLRPLEAISGEKLFEVIFDRVELHADDLLGPPGQGWARLGPALAAGALARSAEAVGAAQQILDLCVEDAGVRLQSGRPIGAFQAIQHACADLLRHVDAARWVLYEAAWRLQEGVAGPADVATAKAYVGTAGLAVARRAHQIFGAISYCEEHPLHLYHKRIQAAQLDFGDPGAHLETVASAIGLA